MKQFIRLPAAVFACAMLALPHLAAAQTAPAIPPAITTPDKVETPHRHAGVQGRRAERGDRGQDLRQSGLHARVQCVREHLPGGERSRIHKGLLSTGVKDNEVIVFSELMDASSLFLTANADTVYAIGMLDLSKGPMVLEPPPGGLGAIDDQWFRWIIDIGPPGPDRGRGGKYLIVPPGYDGPLPEGGFFVAHAKTYRVLWFARSFMENNDPKPVADRIKERTKIYPYEPAAYGTSIAEFLTGKVKLGQVTTPPPTVFHEGTGKAFSTIPPNDFSYYEMLNEIVQQEPATSLDPELMGPLAAIGIVKGKPFAPDARMKKILTEALAVANATGRTLFMNPREAEGWAYYPGSAWWNQMFAGGYNFETPIPLITPEGAKPFPPTGYRMLNERTSFFYGITAITPAMAMRADRHRLAIPLCPGGCATRNTSMAPRPTR